MGRNRRCWWSVCVTDVEVTKPARGDDRKSRTREPISRDVGGTVSGGRTSESPRTRILSLEHVFGSYFENDGS